MKRQKSGIAATVLAATMALACPAAAQEIGRLYAARPPEGSAFVRVVSGLPENATVALDTGNWAAATLSPQTRSSTDFRILKGGVPATLSVNGTPLAAPIDIPQNAFVTILLRPGSGAPQATAIVDSTRGHDDLKAELRVYNLVDGCEAQILLSGGQAVFKEVQPAASARRAINPVKADLQGACGAVVSAPLSLPALKAGDRYSLFLTGTQDKPVLWGQIDRTEPVPQGK